MRTHEVEKAIEATQNFHRHLIEAVLETQASCRAEKLMRADGVFEDIAAVMGFRIERLDHDDAQLGITAPVASVR